MSQRTNGIYFKEWWFYCFAVMMMMRKMMCTNYWSAVIIMSVVSNKEKPKPVWISSQYTVVKAMQCHHQSRDNLTTHYVFCIGTYIYENDTWEECECDLNAYFAPWWWEWRHEWLWMMMRKYHEERLKVKADPFKWEDRMILAVIMVSP